MDKGEIILYQANDGNIKIDVRLEEETVWLTIDQMSELFQKSRSTINEHILNIYEEHELDQKESIRKIGISDFSTKPTNYYNLDVIISVGYRVKSLQGTQFRIWATQRLKEYIVKGFALNDERFKSGSSMNYFNELRNHGTATYSHVYERLDSTAGCHPSIEWQGVANPCREHQS